MRSAIALAGTVLALGLAACGGDDEPAPAANQAAAQTSPTATPPGAQTTAPQVTATPSSAASPAATSAASETPPAGADAEATATPPASSSDPAPTPTATPTAAATKASEPMRCMTAAKLKEAKQASPDLWSGKDPKTGTLVAINGPYKTERAALKSIESFAGMSEAQVGGRYYVVSSYLGPGSKARVIKLADCLDARQSF